LRQSASEAILPPHKTPRMKPRNQHILLVVAKLVIASALLATVISKVHWNDYQVTEAAAVPQAHVTTMPGFKSSLTDIRLAPVGWAVAAYAASLILTAVRWRFLLAVQGVALPLWQAMRLTFLGLFFNTIVPGTVGGDLFKAYYAAKHTPNKAGTLVATFVDRAVGMTGLALLSAAMLATAAAGGLMSPQQMRLPAISILVIGCVLVVAAVFLFSRRFRRAFHLQKLYKRLPIAHHIGAAGEAVNIYRRRWSKLLSALGVTVFCHLLFVLSILLLGASMSLDVPPPQYFLYIPLIYVIGAVPITPGGVGLVEKLFVTFFAVANPSAVLALALLARMMPMVLGALGLWVFLSGPRPPKASQIKQELAIADAPEAASS